MSFEFLSVEKKKHADRKKSTKWTHCRWKTNEMKLEWKEIAQKHHRQKRIECDKVHVVVQYVAVNVMQMTKHAQNILANIVWCWYINIGAMCDWVRSPFASPFIENSNIYDFVALSAMLLEMNISEHIWVKRKYGSHLQLWINLKFHKALQEIQIVALW